jgi:glycine/D-amino acid oxidase-like deaminating enzyme
MNAITAPMPLGDGQFDCIWWGHLAATDNEMPHVCELAPGVLSWTGCNGRGVALATALGRYCRTGGEEAAPDRRA